MWPPSPQIARLSRILELQTFQLPTALSRGSPEKLVAMHAKATRGRTASMGSTVEVASLIIVSVGMQERGSDGVMRVLEEQRGLGCVVADKIRSTPLV